MVHGKIQGITLLLILGSGWDPYLYLGRCIGAHVCLSSDNDLGPLVRNPTTVEAAYGGDSAILDTFGYLYRRMQSIP